MLPDPDLEVSSTSPVSGCLRRISSRRKDVSCLLLPLSVSEVVLLDNIGLGELMGEFFIENVLKSEDSDFKHGGGAPLERLLSSRNVVPPRSRVASFSDMAFLNNLGFRFPAGDGIFETSLSESSM